MAVCILELVSGGLRHVGAAWFIKLLVTFGVQRKSNAPGGRPENVMIKHTD